MAGISIAVVGAGASAVAFLAALDGGGGVEPGELLIFDPSRWLWRGRPYQPDDDCVRVNSVPADMSVVAGDSQHLWNWLQAREIMLERSVLVDELSGSVFIPRAVYGDYLEQSARQALLSLGRRGWRVRIVRELVTGFGQCGDGRLEVRAGGQVSVVDYAVLATGAGAPTDVYGLAGVKGFIADPYPVAGRLFGVGDDSSVAVIGTGLTAVDVALGLRAKGHRGPIRLLSRSGSLPGVRQRAVALQMQHFTSAALAELRGSVGQLRIADVVDLMSKELAHWGEDPAELLAEVTGVGDESGIARLRRHLGLVDDSSVALRLVQQAVPEVGPDIWPYLAGEEQELMLSSHYRTIMSLCCPMPPTSASLLLELADSGQLSVEAGLQGIAPAAGGAGFEVTVDGRVESADVVVSAVNARVRGYSLGAADLTDSLTEQGLALRHRHGGLVTDRANSRARRPDGSPSRLYTLGDPASGSLFFTFGVQSLVDRAVDIARDLAIRSRIAPPERLGPQASAPTIQGAPA
ncbi:MAG TPA: FAD/NAD(P)-binding protein [Jatrophihabitans sp.]|uniref:FAD/NAD(P)-binding protein n=1 Tax=Jatrophihabitans sp. TaxID=1932789 RepID=UPI002F0A4FA0